MEFILFILFPITAIYILYKILKKRFDYLSTEVINIGFLLYFFILIYIVWFFHAHIVYGSIMINIVPFQTIFGYFTEVFTGVLSIEIIITNLLGNILMTLPVGIWLCFNHVSIKKTVVIAVAVPVTIELVQLLLHYIDFTSRAVDIDDVILNFIGIIIGYYFSNKCKIYKKSKF